MNASTRGSLIGGCTLLGIGVGLLFGQPGPGVLIGIGVGLVLQALFGRE